MTLTDSGPLLALLDKDALLLTTWPCFTEVMHLLGKAGGYRYQAQLWKLRTDGRLMLHDLKLAEVDRMAALMKKYKDAPMDLADASLVAVAESLSIRRIFSLDSHFRAYRLANGSVLEVVP